MRVKLAGVLALVALSASYLTLAIAEPDTARSLYAVYAIAVFALTLLDLGVGHRD